MGIEAVDAQVASLVSNAQLSYQREAIENDSAAQAQRELQKKADIKKESLKNAESREVFQRDDGLNDRMQQILGGAAGSEPQNALNAWQKNGELQQKLTEAQKNMFREAMAANPQRGAETANAANRLASSNQFKTAVQTSQQAGTIHSALVDNPGTEKLIADVLDQRFMQSSKADQKTKNDFMRFALQRGSDGKTDSLKKAGDMLGSLVGKGVNANGQRAAMNMATRRPADTEAMSNVDAFVQQPQVSKLPSFARGKSTELLAKANGTNEVKEGLEKLSGNQTFKAQTAGNKGRFFSTIGSGKPSEFRALTDKMLTALQSSNFPTREGQVSKFLGKVAAQAQKGGAASVDADAAVKAAKTSTLPRAPAMQSTEGLSEEDTTKVRSQNRAKVIQYYTQLSRVYEQAEKKLGSAKYFEDVNSLQTLRKPEDIDTANLSSEDKALVDTKSSEMSSKLDGLQKLQRQKSRELRTKRMPAAKRRAMQDERKAVGRKPKYFNPNTSSSIGRQTASTAYAKAGSSSSTSQATQTQEKLATTPFRGQLADRASSGGGGTVDIQRHVATALQQAQKGGLTVENAGNVARAIAETVAKSVAESVGRQVAAQVTQQLMGGGSGSSRSTVTDDTQTKQTRLTSTTDNETTQTRAQTQSGSTSTGAASRQQGKVDGWGIPRTFERDLGATTQTAVRSTTQSAARSATESVMAENALATSLTANGEPQVEAYTGKQLVRDGSAVRTVDTLMPTTWKSMSRSEMALLKNLGWNQQTWDTKDTPAAKWPTTMVTAYVNLSPLQRESVRKLGMTARDWDSRVQAFTSGKNA